MNHKPTSGWRLWLGRLIAAGSWLALVGAVAAWGLVWNCDGHWLGTLLAFGPRWVLLSPIGLLLPMAAVWRRGALVPLGLAGLIVAGPVMGFCVPWRAWAAPSGSGTTIKVISCNTLHGRADQRLWELVEIEQPDVIVLQEWPAGQPVEGLPGTDWQIARSGDVVVASRWPIVASEPLVSPGSPWRTLGLRCELATAAGTVQFYGMHLLTPRDGLEAVRSRGFSGLAELADVTLRRKLEVSLVANWMSQHLGPTIVAGDLNLTPQSTIYHRTFGHLQNAFSTAGWGWGGTKFTRVHCVRIDHILADDRWQITRCEVGPDVGSDHRPVIGEVVRVGGKE